MGILSYVWLQPNKKSTMLLFLSLFSFTVVRAETLEVSAKLIGEAARPYTEFTDTTKILQCGRGLENVALCNFGNAKNLQTQIGFYLSSVPDLNTRDISSVRRREVEINLPVSDRTVNLKHADGTDGPPIKFKITGFGGIYNSSVVSWTAPNWDGSGGFDVPGSGCQGGGGFSNGTKLNFFWDFNGQSNCMRRVSGYHSKASSGISISKTYYSYEMSFLPADIPLLRSGLYRGRVIYTVGANGAADIGLGGATSTVNDTSLTINFSITVPVMFKVMVPVSGSKVELTPEEGWQRWLLSGRRPTELVKNQSYRISSNTPFSMKLECSERQGNNCALRDAASKRLVSLEVNTTLPSGFTDRSGVRINNRKLGFTKTEIFTPSNVDLAEAKLQFVVRQGDVEQMLGAEQGDASRKYQGNVTVVWEADF